eukprot:TRINITY_DN4375_c0_g1_i1.p1 TRINITY_DN4375_c0_g1~~TRINITY_DN4375_c0_g1_i1.p1  ORF type:complete len:1143 (+),score=366.72 TRINITY_DN4375_c0_g1_i1:84-3431(+)
MQAEGAQRPPPKQGAGGGPAPAPGAAPPVLCEGVTLHHASACAPPPPPLRQPRHAGGFPVARRRDPQQRGLAAAGAPQQQQQQQQQPGPAPAGAAAPVTDPAQVSAAAGLGLADDPDGMLQSALDELHHGDPRRTLAAAAVLLRSRVAAQRGAALDALQAVEGPQLRRVLAEADPTLGAQFLSALRICIDQRTVLHQLQGVAVLRALLLRAEFDEWLEALEACDHATLSVAGPGWGLGMQTPLRAWRDEVTMYGLGKARREAGAVADPLFGVPEQELWEPAESVHQIASIVRCDLTEAVIKLDFLSRLRWLLLRADRGGGGGPPVPILECLTTLASGGAPAAAAAAQCPHLVEVAAEQLSGAGAAAVEGAAPAAVGALQFLTAVARGGRGAAEAVCRCAARPLERCADVVHVAARAQHGRLPERLCVAALRLLRVAVCYGLQGGAPLLAEEVIERLFASLVALARRPAARPHPGEWAASAAALQLLGAVAAARGLRQSGLADFAVRDAPVLLAAAAGAAQQQGTHVPNACTAVMDYCAAACALLCLLRPAEAASVGDTQSMVHAAQVLCSAAEGQHGPLLTLPNGLRLVGTPHVPSPQAAAAVAAWPPCGGELRAAVSVAALGEALLRALLVLCEASPAAATAVQGRLVWEQAAALAGACCAAVSPTAVMAHAALPKRESRVAAALRRAEVRLCAAAWRAAPADAPAAPPRASVAAAALNLTLYLQPRDLGLWGELVELAAPPHRYPELHGYLARAPAPPSPRRRGLWMSYAPGRLEPQPEWVWLPIADTPAGTDLAPRRHVAVSTGSPPTPAVLQDWAAWLAEAQGAAAFPALADWRERALRVAGAVAAHSELFSAPASPLAALLAPICAEARAAAGGPAPDGAELAARLGEPPEEVVSRLLCAFTAAAMDGDATMSALILLFLHPAFPSALQRKVASCAAHPQHMGYLGGCFEEDAPAALNLGWRLYCGGEADTAEAVELAQSDALGAETDLEQLEAAADSPDPPLPAEEPDEGVGYMENVMYHRAVHRLSLFFFPSGGGALDYTARKPAALLCSRGALTVLRDVLRYTLLDGGARWGWLPRGGGEVQARLAALSASCGAACARRCRRALAQP